MLYVDSSQKIQINSASYTMNQKQSVKLDLAAGTS